MGTPFWKSVGKGEKEDFWIEINPQLAGKSCQL